MSGQSVFLAIRYPRGGNHGGTGGIVIGVYSTLDAADEALEADFVNHPELYADAVKYEASESVCEYVIDKSYDTTTWSAPYSISESEATVVEG